MLGNCSRLKLIFAFFPKYSGLVSRLGKLMLSLEVLFLKRGLIMLQMVQVERGGHMASNTLLGLLPFTTKASMSELRMARLVSRSPFRPLSAL